MQSAALRLLRSRRRGIALVWTALILLVLIGLVGAAVDYAHGQRTASQLQRAVDAAAMAGAWELRRELAGRGDACAAGDTACAEDEAEAEADRVLGENAVAGASPGSDAFRYGEWECVTGAFSDDDGDGKLETSPQGDHNAMRLVASAQRELFFGPIFGVDTITAKSDATAAVRPGNNRKGDIAMLLLSRGASPTLLLERKATLTLADADPGRDSDGYVNSDDPGAVELRKNSRLNARTLFVRGGTTYSNNRNKQPDATVRCAPLLEDPYDDDAPNPDDLEEPDVSDLPGPFTGVVTKAADYQGPGWYPDGFDVGERNTIRLEAGDHAVGGVGLHCDKPGAQLRGTGVFFYVKDTAGDSPSIRLAPNRATGGGPPKDGLVELIPQPNGDHANVLLFQERGHAERAQFVTVRNGNPLNLSGLLYLPDAPVEVTAEQQDIGLGWQLVARTYVGRNAKAEAVITDQSGVLEIPGVTVPPSGVLVE